MLANLIELPEISNEWLLYLVNFQQLLPPLSPKNVQNAR